MANKKTKQNPISKQILALVLVAAVALTAVLFINYRDTGNSNDTSKLTTQTTTESPKATISEDGKSVEYAGVEGQDALTLLKKYTDAGTDEFIGLGEYVTSINGLASDSSENYWAFYVNGEAAQVGAGDLITKDGDKIEWRLEDVSTFIE